MATQKDTLKLTLIVCDDCGKTLARYSEVQLRDVKTGRFLN